MNQERVKRTKERKKNPYKKEEKQIKRQKVKVKSICLLSFTLLL
jgi:predicted NodU family carbamoyl transferase